MKNKIRVVNKFFLESLITLLPFCIFYIILGIWLSDVTDFGRAYVIPSGVTDFHEIYGSVVKQGFIEFDTFGPEFKNYSFEVSRFFWGGLLLSVLLIVIGKLLALGVINLTRRLVIGEK